MAKSTASITPPIRVEYPAIDDVQFEGNPVLRGVVSQCSLAHLQIDNAYQREFLSPSSRRNIKEALVRHQRLPDIELGMRGENWAFEEGSSEIILLHDPVFVIDGQQRRGTTLNFIEENPEAVVRQGALIHFNTTMEWERERFRVLNLYQTRVASSLLLRNLRSTSEGVATLYGLTVTDPDFPLRNRVSWTQSRNAKDLISANLFIRATLLLHGHMGGGIIANSVAGMEIACQRLIEIIGMPQFRQNTKTFWESIEDIWGITTVGRIGATWLKASFLTAFPSVISDHRDFWQGNRLVLGSAFSKKLKTFDINDPEIRALARSSGASSTTLQFHLIQHLNKNRPNLLDRRPDLSYEHRAKGAKITREKRKEQSLRVVTTHH